MAVLQRSEFALALNQIASERGVDPSVVLETMKGAILAAYRKDNPGIIDEDVDSYIVDLNENTGETRIMKDGKDVTPPGFGRIAAQTAKQVLLQKIREREKDATISEYSKRVGTIVNGMILRFIGPAIIVDVGKAEAVIEPSDKIPNEQYFLNKKMPVYIKGIDEERREIMVSRSDPGLIEGLLRREVPEVSSGSVTVKRVVREPGNRAKIAVYSEASGIDPVGSCVGQKGVRIQAIIDALDGLEKIDVIQWSPDTVKFITNALSPAKNLKVEINSETKTAKVTAPREELPLIIGREGQNVRLASKLTEYNIDVEAEAASVETSTSAEASVDKAGEAREAPAVEEAEQKADEKEEKTAKETEVKEEKATKGKAVSKKSKKVEATDGQESASASTPVKQASSLADAQSAPEDTKSEAASVLPKQDSGEPQPKADEPVAQK